MDIDEDGIDSSVKWKDLYVGDIVYLKKNETVPADLVLLDSCVIEDKCAIAFVDISMVTGYSNL